MCNCKHTRTLENNARCDIAIHSTHNVLVIDVPCSICENCGKFVKVGAEFDEHRLARPGAIDAASMKADGTRAEFTLSVHAPSIKFRNAWKGSFMKAVQL